MKNKNIKEKTYKILKDYIISKEVPPGIKIDEAALAKKLGVSKTPVRDALSKLAHEGITEIIPNRGSFKVKLSKEDILEIMFIRESLEGLCVRMAARNTNENLIKKLRAILDEFEKRDADKNFIYYPETHLKFHAMIYNASKSPRLIRIINTMYGLTHMIRIQYFNNPVSVRRSLEANRELIDALEKKDAELAETIRKKIIRSAFESFSEIAL